MKSPISPILIATLLVLSGARTHAANNFVQIKLPKKVTVELPKNWTALSRNQRVTLESTVQSLNERIGLFDASSDLNFGANYFEDTGKVAAIFNIRYYPNLELSQVDAAEATANDIHDLDAVIQKGMEKASIGLSSIIEWRGTKRQTINGATVFISEYTRTPIQNNGEFCARLVRVFRKADSYTITISYRLPQELLLRPICDRVIASIKNE